MKRRTFLGAATASLAATATATQVGGLAYAASSATRKAAGQYTIVARFWDSMPTGVTVTPDSRVFVCYPRWGDSVPFTVAELRGGEQVAYPDAEVNLEDASDLAGHFQSVQSVVVDPTGRLLWILDTGSPLFGPSSYGGPKLVAVDLRTNKIVQKILFPPEVVPSDSYLNDVRFDLRRGAAGTAFITNSGGTCGIVVVDLATGRSWRRLAGDATTLPDPNFVATFEGQAFSGVEFGNDGIALGASGERLYYSPLSSRRLASVAIDALADPHATEAEVAATVENLGFKPMADGLESDDKGRLYGGDEEHSSIWRRDPDGTYRTIAQGTNLAWIDTLSVAADGYLYANCNQLPLQPSFQNGKDLRVKPYLMVRLPIGAGPVRLA